MKLLLTSAGITSSIVAAALKDITEGTNKKVGFIPTAANVEAGNKDWFIGQLTKLHQAGYKWIDIIDPSAKGVDWRRRLSEVDIVFISGGNTYHLLGQARSHGFADWIQQNIENKVFVGVSAGSIIFTPDISVAGIDDGDPNLPGINDFTGLNLVSFEVSPHSPEAVSREANEEYSKTISNKLIALDDRSAILAKDENYKIISNSYSETFN